MCRNQFIQLMLIGFRSMDYIYIFYTLLKIEFLLIIKYKWNYTHMTGGGVKKKKKIRGQAMPIWYALKYRM